MKCLRGKSTVAERRIIALFATFALAGTGFATNPASQKYVDDEILKLKTLLQSQIDNLAAVSGSTPTPCTAADRRCGVFGSRMKATGNISVGIVNPSPGFQCTGIGRACADEICNFEGQAVAPGSRWRAWLSTNTSNARDHALQPNTIYFRAGTGVVIGATGNLLTPEFSTILSSTIGASIDGTNEDGWTATTTSGVTDGNTCNNWQSSNGDGAVSGTIGRRGFSTDEWTSFQQVPCNEENTFYCFQRING
ncbi:DUF1554 domain-containing protein [Legionella nagasakiensis]|uniref:DUF1554 domain-containing protein n=1 Tax=Legionella nagasakiensis TaxID=535290 RepID=UPI0010557E72|nr:DUF1554 domain-containing protein [Legionella nagasakiensis]